MQNAPNTPPAPVDLQSIANSHNVVATQQAYYTEVVGRLMDEVRQLRSTNQELQTAVSDISKNSSLLEACLREETEVLKNIPAAHVRSYLVSRKAEKDRVESERREAVEAAEADSPRDWNYEEERQG